MPAPKLMDDGLEIIHRARPKVTNRVRKAVESEKDAVIKDLKIKIKNLRIEVCHLRKEKREKLQEVRERASKKVKKLSTKAWQKQKSNYKVTQLDMNARAKEYYSDKIQSYLFSSSDMLSALTGFPFISKYLDDNKIPYKYAYLFIIVCHHQWFKLVDMEAFGMNAGQTSYWMTRLENDGMVERIKTGKNNAFVASLKGQKLFSEIKRDYTKQCKAMIKGFYENKKRIKGWTGIKLYSKYAREE